MLSSIIINLSERELDLLLLTYKKENRGWEKSEKHLVKFNEDKKYDEGDDESDDREDSENDSENNNGGDLDGGTDLDLKKHKDYKREENIREISYTPFWDKSNDKKVTKIMKVLQFSCKQYYEHIFDIMKTNRFLITYVGLRILVRLKNRILSKGGKNIIYTLFKHMNKACAINVRLKVYLCHNKKHNQLLRDYIDDRFYHKSKYNHIHLIETFFKILFDNNIFSCINITDYINRLGLFFRIYGIPKKILGRFILYDFPFYFLMELCCEDEKSSISRFSKNKIYDINVLKLIKLYL